MIKFQKLTIRQKRFIRTASIATIWTVILTQCFSILQVEQPEVANAGETITIVVNAEVSEDPFNPGTDPGGSELVFGFLAPRAWNVAENASVTVNSAPFSQELVLMDEDELQPNSDPEVPWAEDLESRVGFGQNYGEMEWVIYKATEPYEPKFAELPLRGTIEIEVAVGPDNMITQLGYFIGDNEWGIWDLNNNSDFFFPGCMEVINGEGAIINLCGDAPGPSTVEVQPATFTMNDILHIQFDASKGENDQPTRLAGASRIFWCATALLTDGSTIDRCTPTEENEMEFQGDDLWSISLWPPAYFDIADGNDIESITYSFSNDGQNIIVRNPGTGTDFFLEANCN